MAHSFHEKSFVRCPMATASVRRWQIAYLRFATKSSNVTSRRGTVVECSLRVQSNFFPKCPETLFVVAFERLVKVCR